MYICSSILDPVLSSPAETVQSTTSAGFRQPKTPQVSLPTSPGTVAVTPSERQSSFRPASPQEPQTASATGKITRI